MSQEQQALELFQDWYQQAQKKDPEFYNAMNLATANKKAQVHSRIVLLKKHSPEGFVFYTNLGSQKAGDLLENPVAALCFFWPSLAKQVRIEGKLSPVSEHEADAYFASRNRESQIGAWASQQSKECHEGELEKRFLDLQERFKQQEIPRPEFWGGFCLKADRYEFWQEGKHRLHTRYQFNRANNWLKTKLFP